MLWASVNGSSPAIDTVRSPPGSPPVPRRMACAPAAAGEPFGASASSVSAVSFGVSPLSVNRIGARSGAAIRTDPASAARQSSLSASATAVTCWPPAPPGKTIRATAAAVAVEVAVLTRVVFFVASVGYPTVAGGTTGAGAYVTALDVAGEDEPPPPQPARPTAIAATASRAGCGRRVEEAIRRERIGGRAGNRRLAGKAACCGVGGVLGIRSGMSVGGVLYSCAPYTPNLRNPGIGGPRRLGRIARFSVRSADRSALARQLTP